MQRTTVPLTACLAMGVVLNLPCALLKIRIDLDLNVLRSGDPASRAKTR